MFLIFFFRVKIYFVLDVITKYFIFKTISIEVTTNNRFLIECLG